MWNPVTITAAAITVLATIFIVLRDRKPGAWPRAPRASHSQLWREARDAYRRADEQREWERIVAALEADETSSGSHDGLPEAPETQEGE